MSDAFDDDVDTTVYRILPAGILRTLPLTAQEKERIFNALVNEAMAARNLLKFVPDGSGNIGIQLASESDPDACQACQRYGEAVESTKDAFNGTGFSDEQLRV